MVRAAQSQFEGRENLERWEENLIESVSASYGTLDREDLTAELAWRLLVLKRRRRPEIRNWRAYVAKFLRNKASNWIRKNRPRERKTTSLDAPIEAGLEASRTLSDILADSESDIDQRLALQNALDELPGDLRVVWERLIEEHWNQIAVARRLRKHRNTIRARIRRIQQTLIAHGFSAESDAGEMGVHRHDAAQPGLGKPKSDRRESVAISGPLIEAMTKDSLSGTQWRVVLWVMSQTFRRRQRTVPFTWNAVAEALALNRAGVGRAGKSLLRSGLLFLERGRIGLQRNFRPWHSRVGPLSRRSASRKGDRKHRFHERNGS